jgi:hypothetical protein
MSLISIILALVAVGFVLYCINKFIPLEPNVKNLLNIAVIVILIIWLLEKTGLLNKLSAITI